ncbi:MAG: hypothetical protein JXB35_10530 [Anaerolineae bacterium]|nr:hypothetical protein [Anaerolineae bacterium]
MDILKHFTWSYAVPSGNYYGRVGLRVTRDHLKIFRVQGNPLAAPLLMSLLTNVPDLLAESNRQAVKARFEKGPYVVDRFIGQSGCVTWVMRRLVNLDLMIVRRVAHLHISMAGKLNSGFSCALSDLPALIYNAVRTSPGNGPRIPRRIDVDQHEIGERRFTLHEEALPDHIWQYQVPHFTDGRIALPGGQKTRQH